MNILPQFLHFERLGLRRNPFGSLTESEEDDLLIPIPELETWATMSDSLQLMGEKGRGKTSLLRATLKRMTQAGAHIAYESLSEGQNRLAVALKGIDAMAVDEAQRLSLWQKHRLFWQMRSKRLLLTTHEDLGLWFRLYGFPYQTIQVADFITPQRVKQMITQRIAYFALDSGPRVSLTDDAQSVLWGRYGDHVRSTEHALYEVFQAVDAPELMTGAFVERVLTDAAL